MLASPTRKKESMMLMNTGKEVILLKNYKNPVLPPVDEDTFNYPDYNYDYEDDSHKSKKSHKKRKKKSLIKKKDILHELNVDDLSDQDYEGDDTENSNETYSNNVKSMKSIVRPVVLMAHLINSFKTMIMATWIMVHIVLFTMKKSITVLKCMILLVSLTPQTSLEEH